MSVTNDIPQDHVSESCTPTVEWGDDWPQGPLPPVEWSYSLWNVADVRIETNYPRARRKLGCLEATIATPHFPTGITVYRVTKRKRRLCARTGHPHHHRMTWYEWNEQTHHSDYHVIVACARCGAETERTP